MRTAKQRAASRLNGAKSRGPITEAGKRRSCRNSRRHGLYAKDSWFDNVPATDDTTANFLLELNAKYRATPSGDLQYDRLWQAVLSADRARIQLLYLETRMMSDEIDRQREANPDAPPFRLQTLAFDRLSENGAMTALCRFQTTALRRWEAAVNEWQQWMREKKICETNPAQQGAIKGVAVSKAEFCGTNLSPLYALSNESPAASAVGASPNDPAAPGSTLTHLLRHRVSTLCRRGTDQYQPRNLTRVKSICTIGNSTAFPQIARRMSKFPLTRFVGLIIALCVVGVAMAATLQQLSLAQMTQSATAVVRARVLNSSASFTGKTIYTHYKLQVSETWKGSTQTEVMLPGGVAGGLRQAFPGVPTLQAGNEYVLYLWTSPSTGITHIVGLSQGIFNVTKQSDGTLQASRPRIGETMLDAHGNSVRDQAIRMPLAQMKSQVTGGASQ